MLDFFVYSRDAAGNGSASGLPRVSVRPAAFTSSDCRASMTHTSSSRASRTAARALRRALSLAVREPLGRTRSRGVLRRSRRAQVPDHRPFASRSDDGKTAAGRSHWGNLSGELREARFLRRAEPAARRRAGLGVALAVQAPEREAVDGLLGGAGRTRRLPRHSRIRWPASTPGVNSQRTRTEHPAAAEHAALRSERPRARGRPRRFRGASS